MSERERTELWLALVIFLALMLGALMLNVIWPPDEVDICTLRRMDTNQWVKLPLREQQRCEALMRARSQGR